MSVGVVIGYRNGDWDRARAYSRIASHYAEWSDHVVTIDPPGDLYSRALAFNLGAEQLDTDLLVCANSDVLVAHDALDEACSLADMYGVTVYPFTPYYELTKGCSERWLDGDETCYDHILHMTDSVGPVLVVERKAYLDAGGCDPRFVGWGFEDVAWSCVSQTLLGPHRRVDAEAIHFWHKPDPNSWAHKPPVYHQNDALCDRYRAALGDADAIRALQAEHGG